MKVALVHEFLTQYGGGERVLDALMEIFPEAPIYTLVYDQKKLSGHYGHREIITSRLQKYPGMPAKFKYYIGLMPRAIESFDFSEYDLVLSDSSAYAKGVKTHKPTVHISYIHSPTRYLWSDKKSYLKTAPIPAYARPLMPAVIKYLQNWDLKAAKRPDVMIANSQNIKNRIAHYYHRNADYVVFPPVDAANFKISQRIGDYYLIVARQEPYKRTDIAIEAANKLGIKLKVVGGGTRVKELTDLAGPTVEFLGRVSDEELAKLYSQAIAFIFPPNEDAGITPLESMAAGRPVIAFGQGGALEAVVAGKTGEFFYQQTADDLVKTIKNFNPANYDPQAIREHALKFDKPIFKQKIQEIITHSLT